MMDREVNLVHLVQLERMESLVLLADLVSKENLVHLEEQESTVHLDHKVSQVQKDSPEDKVNLVHLVLKGHLVRKEMWYVHFSSDVVVELR